ncbi:pyrroloquinoline quinone biosynthesis protein B [Streptacidiphilus sp. MAP12-20]|uniref:pyrroloquinoline quinone biosynthesis protein PqqB n=1 Tax=Streptacidiphilus sp. MAP12-20 TaxID=3156299 RepID=UPI003519AE05
MRAVLLGTAAGGGVPQWNCACALCTACRAGRLPARTQDCVAVSADSPSWWLLNASPDVAAQLQATPTLAPGPGPRDTPLRGVLLTDAEADHTLGLPALRGGPPLEVLGTAPVLDALPWRAMIDRYTPWQWTTAEPGRAYPLAGGLIVTVHPVGDKVPKYVDPVPSGTTGWVSALRVEDPSDGSALLYAPCFGAWSSVMDELLATVDCALVDGTFFSADELGSRAPSAPGQHAMGHLPVSGPSGSLAALARHPGVRRVYTHLNNTNPLLDPASPARAAAAAAGVDVLPDGTELVVNSRLRSGR